MSDNPYEAVNDPQGPFGPPAAEQKPTSVTVLGILNIVFALMGVCGMVGMGVMMFGDIIPQNPDFPNPTMDLMNNSPGYRMFMIISMVLGSIFSIVLGVAGIGLLQGRRFGRSLSMAYAWYAIVAAIGGGIANYFFVFQPLMEQVQQAQGQNPAAMGGAISGIVGGVVGACGGMIYPVVLLIFMNKANVIRSLK